MVTIRERAAQLALLRAVKFSHAVEQRASRPSSCEVGGRGRPALHQQGRRVRTPPGLYSDSVRSNAADVRDIITMKIIL